MRTKMLVLTAAAGLFGAGVSMAQVYSVNAVGFYNLSLGQGFSMIANQLNNGDNTLNTILPDAIDGATILKWDITGQAFGAPDTYIGGAGWFDVDFNVSTTTITPGEGAFINIPVGQSLDVTLVGEVPQGTLTLDLEPGFQIISGLVPQAIGLDATGFPATDGDTILFWETPGQAFSAPLTYIGGAGWFDVDFNQVDPTPAIGQSIFYNRSATGGTDTWTREFSVNP